MDMALTTVAIIVALVCVAVAVFAFHRYLSLARTLQESVQREVQAWKQREWDGMLAQSRVAAMAEAAAQLAQWRTDHEILIREDAVKRSQAVISGKVTEHLAPYLGDFPFNPKDVRFLGSPVDLVVFDGMDGGDLRDIVLVEIKTAGSSLTGRERQIRDAVQGGRTRWLEYRLDRSVDQPSLPPKTAEQQTAWYRKG